jgi:hypothetical protein
LQQLGGSWACNRQVRGSQQLGGSWVCRALGSGKRLAAAGWQLGGKRLAPAGWQLAVQAAGRSGHLVQWMQRVMTVFTRGPKFLSSTARLGSTKRLLSLPKIIAWRTGGQAVRAGCVC